MPPVPHRRLSQTLRAADAHDARKAGSASRAFSSLNPKPYKPETAIDPKTLVF